MKLYFAGSESQEDVLNRVGVERRMFSYYYLSEDQKKGEEPFVKDFSGPLDLFIDSGAFTAHNQGQPISRREYGKFLQDVAVPNENVTMYANLDVIGDAEETMMNQMYLDTKGLSPIPVFHYGQAYKYLREIVGDYDMIALGGMVGRSQKEIQTFLDKCFSIIKHEWPIKVHSFGMTGKLLKRYPFYSADSTTWFVEAKFGRFCTFKPNRGVVIKESGQKTDEASPTKAAVERLTHKQIVAKNLEGFLRYERYLTRLWEKRGISWNHEPALDRYAANIG